MNVVCGEKKYEVTGVSTHIEISAVKHRKASLVEQSILEMSRAYSNDANHDERKNHNLYKPYKIYNVVIPALISH